MRAVVCDAYGPPEVLRLEEVPQPIQSDDEALVRIRATTVARADTHLRSSTPFFQRFQSGLRRPLEAGEYRPVVDRTYPLEDVVEASGYVETEQKTGNVVLTLNGGPAR